MQVAEIETFFSDRVTAFTAGAYRSLAEAMRLPMHVPVGSKSVYVSCADDVAQVFACYHRNLTIESYERTDLEVHHIAQGGNGAVRVLAHWVDRNSRDAEIARVEVSYFCETAPDGTLEIALVEILKPPAERLLAGIPQVARPTAV